ncbi:hypothetical protein [Halalkalibacter akibai]|uniref:HNH endonuclease n=1 Tax=Halalkalibacter akibai (strain ATCC 43226 / DSM 21942 / CIP 109018 / JCM 9157 / 1139) TaxID=1236973 RepID=W4QZF1_HALA3|nr:hypothetical protein [Halalkalibacter akibai]GAE37505.1 hypothetical protein JCM9157_4810 [Halalkalibacter akibai JCM 9157]
MWKIKNDINEMYLRKFEAEVTIPVFNMIRDITTEIRTGRIKLPLKSKEIWKNTSIFTEASEKQKRLFTHIMQRTISGRKLEDIIYIIVTNCTLDYVEDMYQTYLEQNAKIKNGNYDVDYKIVDEFYRLIFIDFYYSNFFTDDIIWSTISGDNYNRSSFHRNFRTDNKLAVCPYCDIDTTRSISNNNIEHFLPKSKYPFLAMNPLNLISSCIACNKAHEGKGEKVSDPPIITPYNEMIGEFAEFDIDFEAEQITLRNKGGQAHHNYFNLLKLYTRYSDSFIFECVDGAAHSLFETLSNYQAPSKEAIEAYIKRREKREGLSFALKSAISKYPHYQSY